MAKKSISLMLACSMDVHCTTISPEASLLNKNLGLGSNFK